MHRHHHARARFEKTRNPRQKRRSNTAQMNHVILLKERVKKRERDMRHRVKMLGVDRWQEHPCYTLILRHGAAAGIPCTCIHRDRVTRTRKMGCKHLNMTLNATIERGDSLLTNHGYFHTTVILNLFQDLLK